MHKLEKTEIRNTAIPVQPAEAPKTTPQPSDFRGRRSSRVTIAIPIVVYGKGLDSKMFYEETITEVVNAHGGRFVLRTAVARQQKLVLVNPKKGIEVSCCVVYLGSTRAGLADVGIEFDSPEPRFWGITFPPPDWNNADRKRPEEPKKR